MISVVTAAEWFLHSEANDFPDSASNILYDLHVFRQLDEGGFFIARRTTFRTLQELVEQYSV
jgi:hypothetical protein